MLDSKGMRFPIDVILVRIRGYAAYPLRDRKPVHETRPRVSQPYNAHSPNRPRPGFDGPQ